ncbi:MAG: septum formation family protein [Nocardioides sp.]|nr:septum formation family protein [Nocardioides sp.]
MLIRVPIRRACALATIGLAVLAGCSKGADERIDPDQVDAVEKPQIGACRVLEPDDVAKSSNATKTVACEKDHTAETFAVGPMPGFDDADYDDPQLSTFAFRACSKAFEKFLGADESLVMRTVVSWAWFRPSEKAWNDGARWYRCDVVGGGEESEEYIELPTTAKGLLRDRNDDTWLVCADGATVAVSVKVPCSEPHTWRAVTTIKVGKETDPYPGDRMVEVKSRDFCSDSVGAWMNYPIDYDFAYTWFHEAEWEAGNRRSVCWAKTEK